MSDCSRFEESLREHDVAAIEEYSEHLGGCGDCAALARDWTAITIEAKSWPAPEESPRFRQTVLSAVERDLDRIERSSRHRRWLTAAAAALLMTLGMAAVWSRISESPANPLDEWIVRNKALAAVERSETEYKDSIERLATIVAKTAPNADSPKLASLQEKILLLDQAISECEALVDENPYHADLRHQLLAVYRQKDEALREVLEVTRQ